MRSNAVSDGRTTSQIVGRRRSAPTPNAAGVIAAGLIIVVLGRLHDAAPGMEGTIPAAKILLGLGALVLLTEPTIKVLQRALGTIPGKGLLLFIVAIFWSVPFSYVKSSSLLMGIDYVTRSVPIVLILLVSVRSLLDFERLMRSMAILVVLIGLIIAAGFGVVYNGKDGARTTLPGAYDPNDLALVVAWGCAFCLWALRDRSRIWRGVGGMGFLLGLYVIGRTYSRGGAIALAVLVVMSLFLARRTLPSWLRIGIVPTLLVALLLAPANYTQRLNTLTTINKDYNTFDVFGRQAIWTRGLGYFVSRPLNGVGAGQFGLAEGRWGAERGIEAGFKWSAAHNMYVESAAELGLPGLIGLLCMLLPNVGLWRSVRKRRPESEEEHRYQRAVEAVALATITFMTGAMFLSATYGPMVLFLTAFGLALHIVPLGGAVGAARSGGSVRHRPLARETAGSRSAPPIAVIGTRSERPRNR